jgi:hypothetical protein
MTEKDFALFERGERVDQPDLQHAVEATPRNIITQIIEELILGADGAPTQVWGFDTTIASPVITVTRGVAITGYRDRGTVYRGILLAGGPANRTINVATYQDGTYGVYVRMSLRPTAARNRRFWNALGPAEVLRLANTRIAEDWDLVLERANPGADYLLLGTVPITGGALGAFTRSVSRLFDSARANRVLTDADWGAAADRNAADTAGLRGLTRFNKMVLRQLQDIIGGVFFGSPITGTTAGAGARNLTQLNGEKLGRSGEQPMTGDLYPNATNTLVLGQDGTPPIRWLTAFVDALDAFTQIRAGDAGSTAGSEVLFQSNNNLRNAGIIHDPAAGARGRLTIYSGVGGTDGELELDGDVSANTLAVAGAASANSVAASTLAVSGAAATGPLTVTGAANVTGQVAGSTLALGTIGAAVPAANQFDNANITKAWVVFTIGALGAITVGAGRHKNIDSVVLVGSNTIRITFQRPFSTGNLPVFAGNAARTDTPMALGFFPIARSEFDIDLQLYDDNFLQALDGAGTSYIVDLVFEGRQ